MQQRQKHGRTLPLKIRTTLDLGDKNVRPKFSY